jgi:hypothetical protein
MMLLLKKHIVCKKLVKKISKKINLLIFLKPGKSVNFTNMFIK